MLTNVYLGSFSIFKTLQTMQGDGTKLVGLLMAVAGVVAIGYGGFEIVKGVMTKQGKGSHIVGGVIAIIVGAFVATSGYDRLQSIGDGSANTVNDWSNGKSAG